MSQTVLLVDDSSVDRSIYQRFLSQDDRQSYEIVEFETGEAALEWCQSHQADVILLDYLLPQMNGLEFLQRLRQHYPDDIFPVILLTGFGNTAIAVEAIKSGAQDYLDKEQLTQENLSQLVRSVAQQVQLNRKLSRQQTQQRVADKIALWMRQSFNSQHMLEEATQEIRRFLQVDRVLVYQFSPDWSGLIVAESVGTGWPIALKHQIQDTCFQQGAGSAYLQGQIWAVADIEQVNLTDCHRELLKRFAVKANLVVPILEYVPDQSASKFSPSLWGLLIAHHCAAPHAWQEEEIVFLQQVAIHLSGAMQQVNLYQQAQLELQHRRQAESRFQQLVEQSPFAINICQTDGNTIYANQAWEKIWQATRDQALGFNPLHHPYTQSIGISTAFEQALAGEIAELPPVYFDPAYLGKPGRARWMQLTLYPLSNHQGEVQEVVGVTQDWTERKQAENGLAESESRLSLAQAASKSGVWDWDLLTNSLFWSPEYYQLYRLDPSVEPNYEAWLSCIHPDDRELVNRTTLQAIDDPNYELRVEFRAISAEPIRWFAGIGQVLRNEAGEPIRLIGITIDITQQKQAELALKASEAQFHQAILQSPFPIKLHAEDGEVLLINQAWTDITGYTHAEIPTISDWTEKAYAKNKERVRDLIHSRFSLEGRTYVGEFSPITKSGETRIWDLYAAPLGSLPDGRRFMISTAVDCTEQRLAQNQLQSILDSSEVVVYLKDREGKYLLINQQYEVLTELNRADVLGKTDFDLYPAEVAQIVQQNDQHVLLTGESLQFEETVPLPQGTRIYLAIKFPLQDSSGRIYAVCGMSTDITELKQAQESLRQSNEQLQGLNRDLERANHAKDAFLRMMGHELRTPLNPILGMAEGLEEEAFGPLNDRQRRAVSKITDRGQHLLRLVNNILDLVNLEASKISIDRYSVRVSDLCRASLATITPQAEAKTIQLQTDISPEINVIQVDGERIKQVLIQLLENAVKFTPEGGTVSLQVRRDSIGSSLQISEVACVQFSIRDTGIGIAPEDLQYLFKFFTQLDDRLNRDYTGIGIGLALVQRLTELHEGHLTVESQVGQGSCFTINIPCFKTTDA